MTHVLDKLLGLFATNSVISSGNFNALDVDDVLDERDDDPFDSDWMNAFNEVKKKFEALQHDQDIIDKINKIREVAFKATFVESDSGDLSGYVSDDFEMISKALVIDSDNKWVAALLDVYLKQGFPYGKLNQSACKIRELPELQ